MATPQNPIEIPLGGGPAQSTGRLFRGPDTLERAQNVDHTQAGYLIKARGFTRIPLTTTALGETPEAVFVSLGLDRGELVAVGLDRIYAVAANSAAIDGAALVRRGPSMIGQYNVGMVHGSAMGDG